MEMLKLRVGGKSYAEIAARFEVSKDTVKRSLDWAFRQGLVKNFENKIISELVPKAIAVYSKQLDEGDAKVASDIIGRLMELGDRFESREQAQEEITLKGYLESKRKNELPDPAVINSPTVTVLTPASLPPHYDPAAPTSGLPDDDSDELSTLSPDQIGGKEFPQANDEESGKDGVQTTVEGAD